MNVIETVSRLFQISKEVVEEINQYKRLSNAGEFEVLLFATNIVLNVYRKNRLVTFSVAQDIYFEHLEQLIGTNNLEERVEDIAEFMNERFVFYSEELNNLNDPNYLLGKIYNVFYNNPLGSANEFYFDLPLMLSFGNCLRETVKTTINKAEITVSLKK